jgi:hypothetical protein
VRNIRADGRVRVRVGGRWFDGDAVEVEGGPDDDLARHLLAAKYQGWTEGRPLSGWARGSLPVAVDIRPAGPPGNSAPPGAAFR